jgi:hypothetical protein
MLIMKSFDKKKNKTKIEEFRSYLRNSSPGAFQKAEDLKKKNEK